jgi:BASS family bile acid:Na+ symporter
MVIDQVVSLLAAVTLVEMMITLGLGVDASDVIAIGKRPNLLLRALVANYIFVPLLALGWLVFFHATPMVAAGFLVAAVCPGAPYAPAFTAMAKGNVNIGVGLMVVLASSSAILAPLLLGFLLPLLAGSAFVQINVLKMIGTLLGAQLLPLGVGGWIRHSHPIFAAKLKKPAGTLSLLLNLLFLGVIISVQFQTLVQIHPRAYFAMLCLVLSTLLAGRLASKRGVDEIGKSMILTTAVRNVGVSLVIATGSFPGTPAITATTTYAIFQTIVIALIAFLWGRYTPRISLVERKAALRYAACLSVDGTGRKCQ